MFLLFKDSKLALLFVLAAFILEIDTLSTIQLIYE